MNDDLVLFEQQNGLAALLLRAQQRYLDCSKLSLEDAEQLGELLATIMRDSPFWLGDLARYCEHRWPDTHHQVWPVFASPGQLARNSGVCRAYPDKADREHHCTFSQYMQAAGKPDRQQLLSDMVGRTTDETRNEKRTMSASGERPRWLLAVDCNYFLHRWWHSGAGVEAASGVASWIERTAKRLQEEKGLTDLACCFDSKVNHRKEMTAKWEDKYKDRPAKDPELGNQINLLRDLIAKAGYCVVSVEGMEADDVMASYAAQFTGNVTLLTQDKDQRQCLSSKCNILLDVTWKEEESTGEMMPDYKWLSAKKHLEETSVPHELWTDYQCLMGDNVDGITGAVGIGKKGAADIVLKYGSAEAAIEAAKKEDAFLKPTQRKALIEFEAKLEVTRKLVTLRADLNVPSNTRF